MIAKRDFLWRQQSKGLVEKPSRCPRLSKWFENVFRTLKLEYRQSGNRLFTHIDPDATKFKSSSLMWMALWLNFFKFDNVKKPSQSHKQWKLSKKIRMKILNRQFVGGISLLFSPGFKMDVRLRAVSVFSYFLKRASRARWDLASGKAT